MAQSTPATQPAVKADHCYNAWSPWSDEECQSHTCGSGYQKDRHRVWNVSKGGDCAGQAEAATEYSTEACTYANGTTFHSCDAGAKQALESKLHTAWRDQVTAAKETLELLNTLYKTHVGVNSSVVAHDGTETTFQTALQAAMANVNSHSKAGGVADQKISALTSSTTPAATVAASGH